jgi:hypothetical protein
MVCKWVYSSGSLWNTGWWLFRPQALKTWLKHVDWQHSTTVLTASVRIPCQMIIFNKFKKLTHPVPNMV